ncbi:hypothetical protein PF010_g13194 [Phytophthora fragariae]|nr:hypothetical protein PF010_g13194 [Phytophthora fragariae]
MKKDFVLGDTESMDSEPDKAPLRRATKRPLQCCRPAKTSAKLAKPDVQATSVQSRQSL